MFCNVLTFVSLLRNLSFQNMVVYVVNCHFCAALQSLLEWLLDFLTSTVFYSSVKHFLGPPHLK